MREDSIILADAKAKPVKPEDAMHSLLNYLLQQPLKN